VYRDNQYVPRIKQITVTHSSIKKEKVMKLGIRLSLPILILILTLVVSVGLTQAQQITTNNPSTSTIAGEADQPWYSQYVHQVVSPESVGAYTSLALRPSDDAPFISYYDAANGNLMLATYRPNGGGDCGTDNLWKCIVIDETGDVGQSTSIDIWSDSSGDFRIGISYYDATNRALKYATQSCTGNMCTIWLKRTVSAPDFNNISIGKYSSIKYGPTGIPGIAYYFENNEQLFSQDSLRYAYTVNGGTGNCGEGAVEGDWNCDIIDVGLSTGLYVSMDLTYYDTAYIAYYDGAFNGDLKIAYYMGIVDPDCYDNNGWYCAVLDGSDGSNVGLYASITAKHSEDDKIFRIAYYDSTNAQLKYYDSDFGPVVVDDMGTSLLPMDVSMDVDKNNAPIIAYQQVGPGDFDRPQLLIARPYFAYGDGEFGNCGEIPEGYLFNYWRCNVLDSAGEYLYEAEYASVVVDSSGLAHIAYSELNDYDLPNAMSLKYLYQNFNLYTFLPVVNNH
jgi:hypothetical protein